MTNQTCCNCKKEFEGKYDVFEENNQLIVEYYDVPLIKDIDKVLCPNCTQFNKEKEE